MDKKQQDIPSQIHDLCTGCTACLHSCPTRAITFIKDKDGFSYPNTNPSLCNNCGICREICPANNALPEHFPLFSYAAKAKDEETCRKSASGAIFFVLAKEIILNGGIVFGAGFSDDFKVIHKGAETLEELDDLRGSKYVQSDLSAIFQNVREALLSSRSVLFSGTPCQIAGLHAFLRKGYPNLFTAEVICHGVPTPLAFEKFLKDTERHASSPIASIDARRNGPWESQMTLHFKNKTSLRDTYPRHTYLYAFMENMLSRPSCFNCPVRHLKSGADFTLGDCWSYKERSIPLQPGNGISELFINTPKAQELFLKIKGEIVFATSNFDDVARTNPFIAINPKASLRRPILLFLLRYLPFDSSVRLAQIDKLLFSLILPVLRFAKRTILKISKIKLKKK